MKKLYWKGRKVKNNLVFHIKAFLHKRRDKLAVKKDDLSFERNVANEVAKAFFKNVFIIAIILVVEQVIVSERLLQILPNRVQNIQRYIVDLNANIMEDSSILAGVLSAIIGVAGVFLGLYCANIMSMFAEKYANAPKKISHLFENDIVTNKCIRAITSYLIFSIMVLFLLVLQVDIGVIMLVASGLKGLEIIVQDFCMHFSIVLGKRNRYRQFYKVDEEGSVLNTLLEYEDHMFLEYDFDKLLATNLNSLLKRGKAYVEVVKLFDEDNNLVGIKLIPFRNNIQISFSNRIFYLLRRYDGEIEKGIIKKENVISFKVKDIGYTRFELWRMFRKLRKFDLSFVELSMDSKSGFEFNVYTKKKDLELLKVGHGFRWIGRKYDNYYLNEPYLVYLRMEELKLKEKILNILLHKYNEKLSEIGKKYGFAGNICYETRGVHFDELYKELAEGVKSCAQVSNEIY